MSKTFQRRTEDATGQRYYMQLPTMAVTFSGFTYSQDRAVASRTRRYILDPKQYKSPADFLTDMMPTPWDINFTLAIRTESFQDFCQILEQIIPWFNPSINISVKEFESVNLQRDVRVTLNGLSTEITEEIEEDGKRYVNGSLEFTADSWFYKPISTADNIIKTIHSHYGFDPDFNIEGENFVSRGMSLEEAEDKEKWPMEGSRTRGEVDRAVLTDSNVEQEALGYINEQTADGKPQHIPYVIDAKFKNAPSVELKPESPEV